MDLLYQTELADEQLENEIEKEEETARINRQNGGQDVNTGNQGGSGRKKGRPNRSGKEWDENGNYAGRSGWDKYDGNK